MSIILKKSFLINSLLVFVIVMNILGSYFYVFSRSFSIGFVCVPILLLLIIKLYKKIGLQKIDVYFFSFFLVFLGSCLISLIFHPQDDNFRVFKFLIMMISCFLGMRLLSNIYLDRVVSLSVFIIFLILLLQHTFLLFGFGLNPSKNNPESIFNLLPTSVYGNPNDLSVIGLLLFVYITYKYESKKIILGIICALIVFVSASRSSILLLSLVLLFNLRLKKIKFKHVLVILILIGTFFHIDSTSLEFFEYTVLRVMSITEHFDSGSVSAYGTDSMSVRVNSLIFFFENLDKINFGTMVFKDYNEFFKGSQFYGSVMAENPHNFFVEYSLLYGWFGVISSFFLILFMFEGLKQTKDRVLIFLILIIALTVTSSVINFLSIWLLIFIIILNNEKNSKLSI